MQDILESDWTLGAVKRREEARLKNERAAPAGDAETIQTVRAPDMSGDNWVAAAFRRRQEEERAKAARHQLSGGDRADAANKEVPVDNWLIEGFKRHQQEERRLEIIARSDDAGAPTVGEEHSNLSLQRAVVVVDEIGVPAKGASAGRMAGASSGAEGALVPLGGERSLARRPKGAGRLIAIALVVAVGLVSLFGLKTALWNFGGSPRGFDKGAPSAAPPPKAPPRAKKEMPRPAPSGPSHGEETTHAPPARPADAAPAKPGDAAITPAPPAAAPQSSTQTPAAPHPQPEAKAPSPPAAQDDKSLKDNRPAPVATPAAPAPPPPKEAAAPAKPDKETTAKPAPGGSEGSREAVAPEPEHNAAEPNRHAPSANVDAKSKPQSKEKRSARRSSRGSDGFSTFLKRTANSVRRFFGRLGAQQ